jgi:hypothetical protein
VVIFSRFILEAPQTILGNAYSHLRNSFGYVNNVEYYGGATLVNRRNDKSRFEWGLTLGSYINSQNINDNQNLKNNYLFMHELGHTLQSRLTGPLYLFKVGLPSIIGGALDGKLGHSQKKT